MSKKDWIIFITGFFAIPCATWLFSTRRELFLRVFVREAEERQKADKRLPQGAQFKFVFRIFAVIQFVFAAVGLYLVWKYGGE